MGLTGFLKIPDINGESKRAEHEREIDVFGVQWSIAQDTSTQWRSGRARRRADVSAMDFQKFYDASSPYIALAAMQGKSFDEVIFSVRKDSGDAHLDYLVVTLTNVVVSDYEMENAGKETDEAQICERIGLVFEKVSITYTVQADDHSSGDEHEIEYDIAAGV